MFLIAGAMAATYVIARRGSGSETPSTQTPDGDGACVQDGTRRRTRTGGEHELTRR
jgi:hypothetical protein